MTDGMWARRVIAAASMSVVLTGWAGAESLTVTPAKDNTLYESPTGGVSNGSGNTLFVGTTSGSAIRRAVMQFDLSAAVPRGAAVTGATLDVVQNRVSPGGGGNSVSLWPLTADWGEGTSNAGDPGGGGAPSATGDATWTHRFYNTAAWATAGGDLGPTSLGEATFGSNGTKTFASTPALVAAVQAWVDGPAANFGVLLKEGTHGANRLHSREAADPALRPRLSLTFTRPTSTWVAPGLNGSWSQPSSWAGSVPNGFGTVAVFGPGASARAVTLDADTTLGQLRFDSPTSYTLFGPIPAVVRTLTLDNGAGFDSRIDVVDGGHSIMVPVRLTGPTTFATAAGTGLSLTTVSSTGTLVKTGSGGVSINQASLGSLDVQGGTVRFSGSLASRLGGLTVTLAGTVSLDGAGLLLETDAASLDLARTVRAMEIAAGRIVTGTPNARVGIARSTDLATTSFMNQPINAPSILMRATLAGDGNLDATVNFDDLLRLAQRYGTLAGAHWTDGDSNGDAAVDFDDLLALAQNYGSALASNGIVSTDSALHADFGSDWALARSLVPEPGAFVVAGALVIGNARRKRQRISE